MRITFALLIFSCLLPSYGSAQSKPANKPRHSATDQNNQPSMHDGIGSGNQVLGGQNSPDKKKEQSSNNAPNYEKRLADATDRLVCATWALVGIGGIGSFVALITLFIIG